MRVRNGPATVTRLSREVRPSAALVAESLRPIDLLLGRGRGHPQEGYWWPDGCVRSRTPRDPGNDTRAFPFSAIVGSDDLALALILTTVSPEVGGVLVRGEKGTAKTTMVRALVHVLPALEVVERCRFSCDPDRPGPSVP